jgi:uncharacterized membrane-anchored protein
MMNIICVGLAIALGLAIKELRNKAAEIKMYEAMSDHYYEKSNYLEEELRNKATELEMEKAMSDYYFEGCNYLVEIVAEYRALEYGKTTVEGYDTIPESKRQCKVVSLDEYRR